MKKILHNTCFKLLLPVLLYTVGASLIDHYDIEHLKNMGYAEQEEYLYEDSNGDEHEGKTLVEISGIGKVLTYEDIYFAPIIMFIFAMLFGGLVFYEGVVFESRYEIEHVIFANCILGVLLVWLTTKSNVIPTILFWLGNVAALIVIKTSNEH